MQSRKGIRADTIPDSNGQSPTHQGRNGNYNTLNHEQADFDWKRAMQTPKGARADTRQSRQNNHESAAIHHGYTGDTKRS